MTKTEENLTNQTTVDDFLIENVEDGNKTKEVKFNRFKTPFIIKALTADEMDEISKESQVRKRNRRTGQTEVSTDNVKYANLILTKSIIQPNLKSEKLQENRGIIGDEGRLLKSMLMANELATLTEEVMELSGLDDDLDSVDSLVDQAKK